VDIPAAARFEGQTPAPTPVQVAIQWPPSHTENVLSLRVVNARGEALHGRELRIAAQAAGLVLGPQKIFHRITPEGAVLVSMANLMRPGSFDLAHMDAQEFRGLSLFSVLPGALPAEQMLEELVTLARGIAHRLSAVVQDEHGADLDGVRVTRMRRSVLDAAGESGAGTTP
jgi:cell division protein ZipA